MILPRSSWTDRDPPRQGATTTYDDRPGVEFHHTVGTYGLPASDGPGIARAVDDDHRSRGWNGIFYNALIDTRGRIVVCRPWHRQSNSPLFTIVFPGNYDRRDLTDDQKQAAAWLVADLRGRGVGAEVRWHGQRAAVGCPGRNVIGWIRAGGPNQEDDMTPEQDRMLRDLHQVMAIDRTDDGVAVVRHQGEFVGTMLRRLPSRTAEAIETLQVATLTQAVAAIRKAAGVDPHPAWDRAHAERVVAGEYDLDEVAARMLEVHG